MAESDVEAPKGPGSKVQMRLIWEVAECMYAATCLSDWELADLAYWDLVHRLRKFALSKPKHTASTNLFLAKWCDQVVAAICGEDAKAFEEAWEEFVNQANLAHERAGVAYVTLTDDPPLAIVAPARSSSPET